MLFPWPAAAGAEVAVSSVGVAREVSMVAVALDGRLPKGEARERLPWPGGRPAPAGAACDLGEGRRLYVYSFGAAVLTGASAIPADLRASVEAATGLRTLPETEDTAVLAFDPAAAERPRAEWSRLVTAASDEPDAALDAAALVLAESAALERYERAARATVSDTMALADELAQAGRSRARLGSTVRRVATLARQRLELAGLFFLVDRPELAWESRAAAQVHDALFDHFELRERHQAVLHQLGLMETTLQVLIGLWEGRRARLLEMAIVALIVIEIVLALARAY